MPKYYYELEQGTEEWLNLRKGKMTASHAQEIGNQGKGLETYILKLMAEFYSQVDKEQFSNKDIDRGHELEDQARSIYCFNNGVEVRQVGFIEHSELSGCSPDGLVGEDGMIEIKCPDDFVYFQHLLNKEKAIESKYIWQMQMCLLITGRKWCDYIAYNPNYPESIFTHRITPDQEKFKAILVGLEMGEEKIKAIKKIINKN